MSSESDYGGEGRGGGFAAELVLLKTVFCVDRGLAAEATTGVWPVAGTGRRVKPNKKYSAKDTITTAIRVRKITRCTIPEPAPLGVSLGLIESCIPCS